MPWARTAQLGLAWLFLAALVVQFFLAGAGAFGASDWDAHADLGDALLPASLALLALALLARAFARESAVLFVLVVAQFFLGNAGSEWVAALHAVNALAVFGLALAIATRARRARG